MTSDEKLSLVLMDNVSLRSEIETLKEELSKANESKRSSDETEVYKKLYSTMLTEDKRSLNEAMMFYEEMRLHIDNEESLNSHIAEYLMRLFSLKSAVIWWVKSESLLKPIGAFESDKDFREYFNKVPAIAGNPSKVDLLFNAETVRYIRKCKSNGTLIATQQIISGYHSDLVMFGLMNGILGDVQALILIEYNNNYNNNIHNNALLEVVLMLAGYFNFTGHLSKKMSAHTSMISKEARIDAMTGLWNRLALEEDIVKLEGYYHIITFDIDKFKNINDTYGHNSGDDVIKQVGEYFKELMRSVVGKAYRFGGDEYVGICSVDHKALEESTEIFRKRISSHVFNFEGAEVCVTVSIGLAINCRDFSIGMSWADFAMYNSKQEGRNRCKSYTCGLEKKVFEVSKVGR